jgi:saccharopine dehydrogenase-like NADP-dependent oxidoreductase
MTKSAKRVIVLGGLGQFGRTAAELLRNLGIEPVIASRRGKAQLRVDADDAASVRTALRAGDIVIDTAGPFHSRSLALAGAAISMGFDLIDLNDDLDYAERMLTLGARIEAGGIRVLSSASSVSAVSAAVVRRSGVESPVRVSAFLAPATRHTANAGTARSLIRSVGRPIRIFRDGKLQIIKGWKEARSLVMPEPLEKVAGRLFESADALYLPRIWPSLREVTMYVDSKTPGANLLLSLAARSPAVRKLMETQIGLGTWFARRFGPSVGGIGYEIEKPNGKVFRYAIMAEKSSFITAIAPAVLAAQAIVEGRFEARGLIPPDKHVDASALMTFLQSRGIECAVI